ncbi:leucine-rich repeat receptor-like protein kinase family protein [Actinidia rufa]|uniref:Leucine-rich repeat receptor-like protein kinase family protein n=1 Tax=Actinidia rufa TaxID=165716 RepID=A0A7J0FJB7_9ERIC|nr:leucine-rich repeat receptor-like protein kinase family protein [Actinidia rufa]
MATSTTFTLFLSLTFSLFILTTASSEADILLTFKASIEDPTNSLSNWSNSTATNLCNWTGVTCTASLSLSIASLNLQSLNLSGEISSSLCKLPNLTRLSLADNLFNQPIPLHLSECSLLETLNLSNNLIWGTIPEQISQFGALTCSFGFFGNFTELVVLDLSQNPFLVSEVPTDFGKLDNLEKLLLQSSGFYGSIPESFVGLLGLTTLDLSQNNLTGEVPQKLGFSLSKLVSFDVSQNKLYGFFPNGICDAKGIINLSLHTNFFNGSVPNSSINQCLNLERFQVQNNVFSGDFPNGLWSLPKIKLIRAENNVFSGEIPDSISMAAQLEQVQIDNNSFAGEIPQGLGMVKSLYRFSASLNGFDGEIPPNFCDSPVMSIINLSHNSLSGKIPELRKCGKLVSLALASNSLFGEIPPSLSELPVLTYLDLSDNNLTGSIPLELQNLKLALFNVSFNRLSGQVPFSLISGLPASFLQGNPDLCGPGLPNSCSDHNPGHKTHNVSKLACALVSVAIAVGILIIVAGFYLIRSSNRKSEMSTWRSVFFYPLRVTEHDLIMAMDEKSASGSGVFRLEDFRLPWSARLRIAIGVAQGLAYLHKDYVPHTLHRNVKSTNILLDADFEPKLTDFALDRIVGEAAFQSSLASESALSCYIAPEYGYCKKATEQIDTYSFGVVLLELLTGRPAEETESGEDSLDVVKWVRRKINISNGAFQVLDPKISNSSQQEMLAALDIALRCTSVMPEKRPPMPEVVRSLQSLHLRTCLSNAEFSASEEV